MTDKDTLVDFGKALDPAHGQFNKVPLVFASMQTCNEVDPAWVRVRKIDHGHVMRVR